MPPAVRFAHESGGQQELYYFGVESSPSQGRQLRRINGSFERIFSIVTQFPRSLCSTWLIKAMISASPLPPEHSKFSSAVQSGTRCGLKPAPSSQTRIQNLSSLALHSTWTCFDSSNRLPWRIALVSDSASASWTPKWSRPSHPSRFNSSKISSMNGTCAPARLGRLLTAVQLQRWSDMRLNFPPAACESKGERASYCVKLRSTIGLSDFQIAASASASSSLMTNSLVNLVMANTS